MQRFFIAPELLDPAQVDLPAAVVHQLLHVLRAKPGDHITLLDNTGWEYEAELEHLSSHSATALVHRKSYPADVEPRMRIGLYQALVRESKFDLVLQKGTELGVSYFVPLLSERSLHKAPRAARLERWRRIITEAAEQSGRTRLPTLEAPSAYYDACQLHSAALTLIASPTKSAPLYQILPVVAPSEIRIFIGTEGGFSDEELDTARHSGVSLMSLGKRILRTETAGLAAVAAILFHYQEL